MSSKQIDFWDVVLLLCVTGAVWFFFQLKPIWGLSLFTLVPSVYLIWRAPKNYKKLSIGTLILGFGFGLLFDPIQIINGA